MKVSGETTTAMSRAGGRRSNGDKRSEATMVRCPWLKRSTPVRVRRPVKALRLLPSAWSGYCSILSCYSSSSSSPTMSDRHASGRSNRSSATGNWKRNNVRSRRSAIPEWCGCGCRPVLRWSRTETHPNKPFFGCPNYNTSGMNWCGLFVWTDSVQDEVLVKSDEEDEHGGMKMNIAWKVGKLETDV
ncbi:Zinc finger GRF-type protein [Arachis hypogaea]|nr:Zinc finger GRF-type protein [Arachis hypogaea]